MSFGWSAGDIFTLVVTCYRVVENCREGLTSASLQIKSLRNDVADFYLVLRHLHDVVKESKNIAFFNLMEMKNTIEECKIYLNKYKQLQASKPADSIATSNGSSNADASGSDGLKRRSSFSKPKEFLDRSKETGLKLTKAVMFTTLGGDQEIQVLQRKLARHRQTLVLYLQILERNRRIKEGSIMDQRMSNVEAMVRDIHSIRRLSATGSPEIVSRSPLSLQHHPQDNEIGNEDYEAILLALKEQKRVALMATEQADPNDDTLPEWNDILSHLETISRRVLNAAERTANSTAQRRTGSASSQIKLNHMLTNHHIMGTPPSMRPIQRIDTLDSGYGEMLPEPLASVQEENSGLSESFVESGKINGLENLTVSFVGETSDSQIQHQSMTPRTLLRQRKLSMNSFSRPVMTPSSSSESIGVSTTPLSHSPRQSRTFSVSSSEVSISPTTLHWHPIQFEGWVKCATSSLRRQVCCTLNGGYDSNGQVYALQVSRQDTNSQLFILKLSTHKKRPIPQVEPFGERDILEEGYQAYFLSHLDTEPKVEGVQFFFKEEKSLNKFEAMIYGQELEFTVTIKKISSSSKTLSESQRLRVWKKHETKSLVFYPTALDKKTKYYSVCARDVMAPKTSKASLEFKLHTSNHRLQDLKIEFFNKNDLDLFSSHFLST